MAVSDIRERWRTSLIEATPDWAVEHEHVADVLGRLIWGTDTGAFYREIARLPELPTGTKVLDIPCGSGVALRGVLRPEQELRYAAADLAPLMRRRVRAEADRRGIHWIDWPRLTWRHGRSRTRVSTWSSPTPVVTASRTRRGDR